MLCQIQKHPENAGETNFEGHKREKKNQAQKQFLLTFEPQQPQLQPKACWELEGSKFQKFKMGDLNIDWSRFAENQIGDLSEARHGPVRHFLSKGSWDGASILSAL